MEWTSRRCPNCGQDLSDSYSEHSLNYEQDAYCFEWDCKNCGTKGEDVYDLVFSHQETCKDETP